VRLLFVNHSGQLGGGELSLLEIVRHFGPQATVALLSAGLFHDRLAAAGVETVLLPASPRLLAQRREGGLDPRALIAAARTALRLSRLARRYDVVYANSQKAFVVAALAAMLARRPLIWHLRDILTPGHFSRTNIRAVVALANRFADGVIANSRSSADAFLAAGGHAATVRVIYSGVDPAPFLHLGNADIEAVRARLGLEGRQVIGLFGRLSPWKGQHVALEALSHLPGVHLLVVGAPLFGEGDYERRLHGLAEQLRVTDRVSFLGTRSDVPALMGLVDVVVHTSIEPEPFGRVIVEGMLAGKPVVATRDGGAAEIVEDMVTGRLVGPGDAHELADTLRELLGSPASRVRMGRAGRERAVSLFGLRESLQQTAEVLDEVVRGAQGRRRTLA
jgi:glycosyltransferase involved in cell wall biosynthesis